jgi:hypothetical protein
MHRGPAKRIRVTRDGAARHGVQTFASRFILRLVLGALLFAIPALQMPAPAHANSNDQSHLGQKIALSESPIELDLRPLEDLLTVPNPVFIWRADRTDADLAYAVTLGNDPDLEKRSPFRKKNFDLFRSQHPLTMGERDMLLRFRVRAKARNAVSIELHY